MMQRRSPRDTTFFASNDRFSPALREGGLILLLAFYFSVAAVSLSLAYSNATRVKGDYYRHRCLLLASLLLVWVVSFQRKGIGTETKKRTFRVRSRRAFLKIELKNEVN